MSEQVDLSKGDQCCLNNIICLWAMLLLQLEVAPGPWQEGNDQSLLAADPMKIELWIVKQEELKALIGSTKGFTGEAKGMGLERPSHAFAHHCRCESVDSTTIQKRPTVLCTDPSRLRLNMLAEGLLQNRIEKRTT